VVVCPVDCFYEGEQMLFINPLECVDCDGCVSECPVEAIYFKDNVPTQWKDYIALNAEMAPKCPQIVERKVPLADCRKKP
jgi:ferredoxin